MANIDTDLSKSVDEGSLVVRYKSEVGFLVRRIQQNEHLDVALRRRREVDTSGLNNKRIISKTT